MSKGPYNPPTQKEYEAWIVRMISRGMCIIFFIKGVGAVLKGIFRDVDLTGAGFLRITWHYAEHFIFGSIMILFAVLGWRALNRQAVQQEDG